MTISHPDLLALDFDGVLCDGLQEYFQVAWKTYCEVWKRDETHAPEAIAQRFGPLRALVETGWEMPILIHGMVEGISDGQFFKEWATLKHDLLKDCSLDAPHLAEALDGCRDRWIETDLDSWLGLHKFYPGVVEQLKQWQRQELPLFIITTKEARFARRLLETADITMPKSTIFGKGEHRPKWQTLALLSDLEDIRQVWFVEDRLLTLQSVSEQPELVDVGLFLANWGYNRPVDHQAAIAHDKIRLLDLKHFNGDFDSWLAP
ncbi:MAG: HAD family hydrolase [Cyanobacteria bacterium P01_H01_bin.130]